MTSRFGSKLARLFTYGFTHKPCSIGKSKLLRTRCDVDYYRGILQQTSFPEFVGARNFHMSIFRAQDKNLNLTRRNYRALPTTLNNSAKSELIHQKTSQSASYATAPTKKTHDKASCKIGKPSTGSSSKCAKLKLCNCEAPKKITCDSHYIDKKCKKKEAPYPSFSEACYEEPYNKPSECKICPWKAYDHPTFKNAKKHYHTSAALRFKHPPCDNNVDELKLEDLHRNFQESYRKNKKTEADVQADAPVMTPDFTYLPSQQSIESMEMAKYEGREDCEDNEEKGEVCIKFPFKKFEYIIPDSSTKKEKKKKKDDGECPFKPQRGHRKVIDCPPEARGKCTAGLETTTMLLMSSEGEDGEKRKCPDTRNRLCEEAARKHCPKKRRPKIAPCQEDVLPKKGWPSRKSRKPSQGSKQTSGAHISTEILEMMLPHVTAKTKMQRPTKS